MMTDRNMSKDSQALHLLECCQDCTDIKSLPPVHTERNRNHRLVLDATNDGIAMVNRRGVILEVNRPFAARFGLTVEQAIGTNLTDVDPEPVMGELVAQQRIERIAGVFQTAEPAIFEDEFDGHTYYNRIYPILSGSEVTAVAIFSMDITDRILAQVEASRRAEAEARLAVMKDYFINISHEMRTPLSLILMQTDLMSGRVGDDERMMKLVDGVAQNSLRLTRLVRNLLDLSAIDGGLLTANLTLEDAARLLRDICALAEKTASARGITLRLKGAGQPLNMALDSDKFSRIILNLLSNAVKHTRKGGAITVTLHRRRASAAVSVEDTGEGIPEDKLHKVFSRFYHVESALRRQTEGCGVGLPLASAFAGMLGGSIKARSTPGQGSTFTMALPIREAPAGAAAVIEGFDLEKTVKMEFAEF